MVHLTNRILTMVNRLGSRDKFQNEKWSLRLTKYKEKIPKMILDQTYPTPRRMTSLLNKSLSAFFSRFLKAFSKSDLVPRLRAFNVREEWVFTKFSHQPFCSHLYLFRIVGGVQCTLFFFFSMCDKPQPSRQPNFLPGFLLPRFLQQHMYLLRPPSNSSHIPTNPNNTNLCLP